VSVGSDIGITKSVSSLRIPARVTDFSLLHRPALGSIQRPAPCLPEAVSPGSKRPGCDDVTVPSSVEVISEFSCNFHSDNLTVAVFSYLVKKRALTLSGIIRPPTLWTDRF
jgi:hypothetical protein